MKNEPRYEIVLYWSDEDNAYIAEVPELLGCMADGATYAEALENARQVIEDWIATAHSLGRTVPPPRRHVRTA